MMLLYGLFLALLFLPSGVAMLSARRRFRNPWLLRLASATATIALATLAGAVPGSDLPDQRPFLRIEPGMHTAPIIRIGVDRACTRLVTGSHDKTVRLWALPESGQGKPELLRTLRVPIGEGNDGKIFAVAMAPDGKWVAAGGWSKNDDIYIFDTATGNLVTRLSGLHNVIDHLVVSPDGSRLAATLGGAQGMRMWETGSWHQIAEDQDYGGKDSYGAVFDASGSLFTVADDGAIRRYGAGGGAPEAKAKTLGGKEPFSIAVHRDGKKLAVAFNDSTAVEVYDARSLQRIYAVNTAGISGGDIADVTWSADGKRLYAAGNWGANPQKIVVWQDAGRGRRSETPLAENTVMQLLPCGEGVAAAATDPAFGLTAADGTKRVWVEGVTADMRRKKREAFTLSADGTRVRFGLGFGEETPVLFDLAAFDLHDAPQAVDGLAQPEISSLAISDWENQFEPKLNGKPIVLRPHERSRALAIAPDASLFVLGTEWELRAYNADGTVAWHKPAPGVAAGVNISHDGKLVVAAYADGTIRWHRLTNGQELLALFVNAKDRRWAAWTPKGYYAASAGGDSLIGWHLNRDWDNAADFFSVSKFRETFLRPDIVGRILEDLDEETAITRANLVVSKKREDEDIKNRQPPVVHILSPLTHTALPGTDLTVEYSVRSPSGLPVERVFLQIDGRPAEGAETQGYIPDARQEITGKLKVRLPPRDVVLSVIAETRRSASEPDSVELLWLGGVPQTAKPRMYALVIGAGDYAQEDHKLRTPANDAGDIAAQLRDEVGTTFESVETRVLKDREPGSEASLQNILKGLSWLQRSATDIDDVSLVYFSGHGISIPGSTAYLLPVDFDGDVSVTGLDKSVVLNILRRIHGRVVVFIDACYAADGLQLANINGARRLDTAGVISEFADPQNGIIAFASSTGTERSYAAGRNGYFTKALIEALRFYDRRPDDKVTFADDVNAYLRRRVPALSQQKQTPIMQMSPAAKPVALSIRQ
jgi:WD40 repeat protein